MSIISQTVLNLKYGEFDVAYHESEHGECVSFSLGDLKDKMPVVRFHSACLFGEAFSSLHCDCGEQLEQALLKIKENKSGVVVYGYDEGRGIGLEKKIKSMGVERKYGLNTVEAFRKIGYKKHDYRDYAKEIDALEDLKINKNICLASNNPDKIKLLKKAGYKIKKHIKFNIKINKYNKGEIMLKRNKLNYYID